MLQMEGGGTSRAEALLEERRRVLRTALKGEYIRCVNIVIQGVFLLVPPIKCPSNVVEKVLIIKIYLLADTWRF